jgi:protein SMG9
VFCNPVRARLPSFHDSECGLMTGVLPPFQVQSEDTRAMARHCSVGIELRMSVERFILLDTQPVFSPSVLADIMRPDGLSSISVVGGDPMSAELAHELMGLQEHQ